MDIDFSLASLFAGWALADEVQRRIAADGMDDLRFADGVVFQHLVPEPRTIGSLAERLGVTQQAASKAVADLERRGYVRRAADPGDGRARLVGLTERGEAAIEAGRRHRAAVQRELAARLGEERVEAARATLLEALERVRRRGGRARAAGTASRLTGMLMGMADYTKLNLREDVEDMAPKFGFAPDMEARYARKPLGLANSGASYFRIAPDYRLPFGHKHGEQEEVYVVLSGSLRVKAGDEIVELGELDAIRLPGDTPRGDGGRLRRRGDPRVRRSQHGQPGR